jgi:hypothetical protein
MRHPDVDPAIMEAGAFPAGAAMLKAWRLV